MINFLVKNTTYLVWILLLIPVAYIHYSHTDSIIDPTSSHTRSHATNQEFSAITERMEEDTADIVMGEDNASLHIGTVDDSGHASESGNGTQSIESEGSFGTDSSAYVGSSEQSVADREEYPPSEGAGWRDRKHGRCVLSSRLVNEASRSNAGMGGIPEDLLP